MNYFKMDKPEQNGVWIASGTVAAAELADHAGFDWLLLDGEHGLGSEEVILAQLRAIRSTPALVRIPNHASPLLGRALDFGAAGIMAPQVESVEQARELVSRFLYPPQGRRGLSGSTRAAEYGHDFKDYFARANGELSLILQIETGRGVREAEAIAALPGVAGLFIGHSDLSLDLGCYGNFAHPEIKRAEEIVLSACARYGKIPGMLLKSGQKAAPFYAAGFRMVALGTDIGVLKSGFQEMLKEE